MDSAHASLLRQLPSVHESLARISEITDLDSVPYGRLKHCIRLYLEKTRHGILSGRDSLPPHFDVQQWYHRLVHFILEYHRVRFTRVINGTGVVVHTNLGRSLLPDSSLAALVSAASSASNLELDLATGRRGSRYTHVEDLLCELTGAESALVVNNNAAAVLIGLETLAKGREVIVSRGQLVEIGGSFRIPDIMLRSGARLVEVGATNRTHRADYENAITPETALLLKVHCSNFRIIGFTHEVEAIELVSLAKRYKVATMEDLGSGCLVDLSSFGLAKEPLVQEVVASGVDVVTFSGDKLLGGPQAGIIVGSKQYIERIKRNQLNRALRIDKFTLASLEAVLRIYLDSSQAVREIPTLAMIALPESIICHRVREFCLRCEEVLANVCSFTPTTVHSQVGGGALPEQNLPSWAVSLQPKILKISQLEKRLRGTDTPVIGRVDNDRLLLDFRTVAEREEDVLLTSLQDAFAAPVEA